MNGVDRCQIIRTKPNFILDFFRVCVFCLRSSSSSFCFVVCDTNDMVRKKLPIVCSEFEISTNMERRMDELMNEVKIRKEREEAETGERMKVNSTHRILYIRYEKEINFLSPMR